MIPQVRGIFAAAFTLLATPTLAVTCQDITFSDVDFTICDVDPSVENLRLFHLDQNNAPLASFREIERSQPDRALLFAMNAGMYHSDLSPVGHYIENNTQTMRVIPNAGPGNFGMLPNGVFCIQDDIAQVFETLAYVDQQPDCTHATQSGPMLVIDGALHPRFIEGSTSRHLRNGVGTSADGSRVVFAISNQVVNFHTFARLFRDHLNLPNALYFDGKVSRLHARDLNRSDNGFAMGPIVGVLE